MLLAVFLGSFGLYLHQAASCVTAGDSGEFMTSVATLSLAHAPSFPLYMVLGRVFLELVPWGAASVRLNIFSSLTSSLSLLFLFLIARRLKAGLWVSVSTVCLIAFSTSFWMNSLVTEVFSLNTCLVTFLLFILLSAGDTSSLSRFFLFSFLLGLGLGNHQVLVFLIPSLIAFAWFYRSRFGTKSVGTKSLFLCAGFFLLGFSIYLALPIRSAKEPPLNWGHPTTVSNLYRTITRKDYGSLKLSIGDAPERSLANTGRHLATFGRQLNREMPWPILLLGAAGLLLGLRRNKPFYSALLAMFFFTGPLFYLLSNLPFTAQSEGIMGRFFIMPVMALLLGLVEMGMFHAWVGTVLVLLLTAVPVTRGWAEASSHRNAKLVYDYGQTMLRTLPPRSVLFMDGGDDAFYSLAYLQYGMGKRPDVELHDRGGLIFHNVYGDDFRHIPKEEKTNRREQVEKAYLGVKPLYYSTLDEKALPGVTLAPSGFLLAVPSSDLRPIPWPVMILRSLYPVHPTDYRTRALAAFFPYMNGKSLLADGLIDEGLLFFRRAQSIGEGVDWLKTNLGFDYAKIAFNFFQSGQYAAAERVYRELIRFDPMNSQAQGNLGVVLEKSGRPNEARAQYEQSARLFPHVADPVYNLAVLSWHEKDWPKVLSYLEEVLRRDPRHPSAGVYLEQARQRMGQKLKVNGIK